MVNIDCKKEKETTIWYNNIQHVANKTEVTRVKQASKFYNSRSTISKG